MLFSLRCPIDSRHSKFLGTQRYDVEYTIEMDSDVKVVHKSIDTVGLAASDCLDSSIVCGVCGALVHTASPVVTVAPDEGSILMCNFAGYRKPEMIKTRPVVVVSPRSRNFRTCIVVPCGTKKPTDPLDPVVVLDTALYPFLDFTSYAKCAMVATVRLERMYRMRVDGSNLDSRDARATADDLARIKDGLRSAAGLDTGRISR